MASKKTAPTKSTPKPETTTTPTRTLQESDLKRLPWRSVGPAIMGGRISDMCFAPGNTKTYYVAYATSGLWRTKNHGTTFESIFDKESTSAIGAVAVCDAPTDWEGWDSTSKKAERLEKGKEKIIWVGTGEGNGRNSSSWGNGVYRSTDSGKTWTNCGLAETHDIPRLAVDPRNPDVCYVAALGHLWGYNEDRGLYKTSDGGKTWDKILGIDEKTGCCDVCLDPKNPDTIYAAFYERIRSGYSFKSGGNKGGIYKSTDAGKTWKHLTKDLPKNTGRIGLDVFLQDTNKVIAVIEATDGGANSIRDDRMRGGGVFRSDDGGESWRRCSHRSPRAFYFSKIKFDSQDDNRVYMLGWTTEVSDDGGETFRGGWGDLLHADHHAIIVDPNDPTHIVIGTDGGAYQTFDKGENWDFLNTIAVGQFYNIALDNSEPYRIAGGLQDNGSWVWPSSHPVREADEEKGARTPATGLTNSDIEFVQWGDGFHMDFDAEDPDVVYAEWQGGNVTRVNLKTGDKRWLIPEAREGQPGHRFNWNSPFFVSKHSKDALYLGGNMVFKLTKKGDNWEAISPDLTTADGAKMTTAGSNAENFCTIVSLAESPMKAGILWSGSDDGLVYVTQNDGKAWDNVTPKDSKERYVSRVEPSHFVEGRCYISLDGHRMDDMTPCVMVTNDFGKTWSEITTNLPQSHSVMVVREDDKNENVLYCGTESAMYVSLDKGATWVKMHGTKLPTVPIYDIKQHQRDRDLVIATHGRSVWVLDNANWIGEATSEVLAKALHLFSLRNVKPTQKLHYNGLWSHKMFRAANAPKGIYIDYWISEYAGDDISCIIENEKGVKMKTLSGTNAPGFNRIVWNLEPDAWHKLADKSEEMMMNKWHCRPGKYKVKLKMGEHTEEGTFEILG
jgi:photosystem II stability/assembly factor-like uncharacterized protein